MDLAEHVAATARVVVVSGSTYDPRRRRNNVVLGQVDDPAAITRLASALAVGGEEDRAAWMTPGHPTLALHGEGGQYLAAVAMLGSTWLRWSGWEFDRPLLHADVLASWLDEHGVRYGD